MVEFFRVNAILIAVFFIVLLNTLTSIKTYFDNAVFKITNPIEAKQYKNNNVLGFILVYL